MSRTPGRLARHSPERQAPGARCRTLGPRQAVAHRIRAREVVRHSQVRGAARHRGHPGVVRHNRGQGAVRHNRGQEAVRHNRGQGAGDSRHRARIGPFCHRTIFRGSSCSSG